MFVTNLLEWHISFTCRKGIAKKFELTNILLTIFYKIFQFSGKLLIYNKKETAPELTDAVSFL